MRPFLKKNFGTYEREVHTMPLDTNLMYGEMVGSALIHVAIPIGIATMISSFTSIGTAYRILILLVLTSVFSFMVQFGLLTFLQSTSCEGVKTYRTIFTGSCVGAVLTLIFTALPAYFESLRLTVAQLFGEHKSLLTSEMARINDIVTTAGTEVGKIQGQVGGALSPEAYEQQTFQETVYGVSYWSAFAGAYGIGIGSMIAATCPAVT